MPKSNQENKMDELREELKKTLFRELDCSIEDYNFVISILDTLLNDLRRQKAKNNKLKEALTLIRHICFTSRSGHYKRPKTEREDILLLAEQALKDGE